jgi:eukaryotic-like serine/threonine-protein kinase
VTEILKRGQVFAGRYRIEKFLAEGGFGAVYVAEQIATELRVALKVLWPQILSSQDAVEKFKLEARVAGRVNSDHIVRVIDAGFDDATQMPFLVMELLKGEELGKVVERSGPLAPEVVGLYFRQIASALDKAHGFRDKDGRLSPIVHRDLKPENLFLTHREDRAPCMKILDFGIAKVLSTSTKVTQDIKGTPIYMAFEQAAGTGVSPQTDIWALGLITFYLLTGKTYWRAPESPEGSLTQLYGEVLSLPLVPPSQRLVEHGSSLSLPAGFDAWFLQCVDRDASRRFASAGGASAALAAIVGLEPSPESQVVVSSNRPGTVRIGGGDTPAPSGPSAARASDGAAAYATGNDLARGGTLPSTPPAAHDQIGRTAASAGMGTSLVAASRTSPPLRRTSLTVVVVGIVSVAALGTGAVLFAGNRTPTPTRGTAAAPPSAPQTNTLPTSDPEPVAVPPPSAAPSPSFSASAPSSPATAPPTSTARHPISTAPKPPVVAPSQPPKGPDPYRER